jgi:pyrimidine-nucleoside phosphorylase
VNSTTALPLIEAKRDGKALSDHQIQSLIARFTAGEIPDYQMAALLMAIVFRGMNGTETRALTVALRDSGRQLNFPRDPRPLVDKHSTGGVGDKVSLVLAPLLACLGFRVPMISGRGLGITGGTLDKLESIPGVVTDLSTEQIVEQVQRVGCVICGQNNEMVPADKALYALRDVTGTVPSIPLITASILSKKLAENLDCLVLDVKFGGAAFMNTQARARALAQTMVRLAGQCGLKTLALLTDMNVPLGRAVGNWLEVRESVECLQGHGPRDLQQLVIESAAQLLVQTQRARTIGKARTSARDTLQSGRALQKWEEMIAAQKADLERYRKLLNRDAAPVVVEVPAPASGFVSGCDARVVGEVVRDLGGGRMQKDSKIDPTVGIDRLARPGERVKRGAILCRVHAATDKQAREAARRIIDAFKIVRKRPLSQSLVRAVVRRGVSGASR